MLDVVFGQASDPGRVRPHNEDATGCVIPRSRQESRARGWLFVVADGVGGRDLGEVASAKAIEVMTEEFTRSPEGTSLPSLLPSLIQQANSAIHDEGLHPERRGRHMATTVVACALRQDQAVIVHVGRLPLLPGPRRQGPPTYTRPHLGSGAAQTWPHHRRRGRTLRSRHVLTRSLGPELFVTPDTSTVSLKPDDVLVLCTDGLYGRLYPEDIARFASQNKDADTIARELVKYAVEVDGSDNTTAMVIQVRSIEPMGMYRGRLYPLPVQP